MHPLDGPKFKIERAGEHLERLDQLVRAFSRNNPQLISAEFGSQALVNVYRYKAPSSVPVEISLLTGEIISSLRSSLEYLAWQLVLVNKQTPSDKTGFPILKTPNARLFRQMTAGMPTEAYEAIERLQPYRRGEGAQDDPLWRLHALWTVEKHRYLPIFAMIGTTRFGQWLTDERSQRELNSVVSRLDNGEIELRVRVPSRAEEYLEPQFSVEVIFDREGPGKGDVLPDCLWSTYYLVRDRVIPRFVHFFE